MRLLGAGLLLSTNVLADVGSISGLPDDVLEGAPALASGRRSALVGELSIDTGSELGDGTLHEGALRIAGTEKDGVHDKQDPRTLLEEQRRAEDTEPKGDFEDSDKRHASVIVLLHEFANSIRQGGLALRARLGSGRRRLDGGEQVRPHIGGHMEH